MLKFLKKLTGAALVLVLALVLVFAVRVGVAHAAVDSWGGHQERLTPFSQAVTAATPALVVSAVATGGPNNVGYNQNVRSMVVTSTVSTTAIFHNANATTGATIIGVFGLLANTPLVLSEEQLGQGMKSGIGNPIYVDVGSTATVSITARVRSDPQ